MRLLRALVPLVLVCAALLSAAEPITATISKRGNVRFGPSDKAPISTTLSPGTPVEVLGVVQRGTETWYQIRFPRQGKAWIHQMNLEKIDEKQYKVTAKANVRDDATNGANIVSSVEPGDVVEYQGTTVGMFLWVYPPRAVAYVSAKVIKLPEGVAGAPAVQAPAAVAAAQKPVERLWLTAKQTYANYAAIAADKGQQAKAQTLDWPGLSRQLGEVASNHPESEAKLQAARFKSGVDDVVSHLKRLGASPTVTVPEPEAAPQAPAGQPQAPVAPLPQPPVAQPQPPVVQPEPTAAPAPVAPTPDAPQPGAQPDAAGALANVAKEATAGKAFSVEGFLEQRADAYVVFDSQGRQIAVLTLNPGSTVPLSEYFWRQIGVSGQQDGTAKDDDGRDVPVILVDDVSLIGK